MASNIDIFIDAGGGGIVAGGSAPQGVFPELTRNDVYNLRLLLQDAPAGVPPLDLDTTGGSFKVAIGQVDEGPSSGQFKLILNGVTSSAITFSSVEATLATSIYNAVSNNVSTVAQFGLEDSSFILTATANNTALSFSGDSFTLFPTSSIYVSTRRGQSANSQSQQIIKFRRNPAVYSDNFTNASTAGQATLTKIQDGDSAAGKNETYKIEFGSSVVGGQIILNYGTNSTTGLPVGISAENLQSILSSVTGIGNNNIAVAELPAGKGYSISFVGELGAQNITTSLSLDGSGLYFRPWREGTITMGTSELDELFADQGEDVINPTIEIEYSESGEPKTLYQGSVTVRKDLILAGSSIPADSASYYTKSEANATFVEDLTTGAAGSVDAANRRLRDSGGTDSINWNTRKLLDGSTEYIRWEDGLGFFNNSAIAQPSGANAVSNVISLGLIASSSTYGVLPGTIKTLSATASITFGSISNNSTATANVTVTGANVNDLILMGLPSAICQGLSFFGHVITANTVEIDAVNATNGTIVQSNQTFRVTVIGY